MTARTARRGARRPRRPTAPIALVLTLVLVAAGCGVSDEETPRTIADDDVPFGLLDEPATTTIAPSPANARSVTVYLVDDKGALRPTTRFVQAPVTAAKVMEALLEPTMPAEAAAGLATSITADTRLRGLDGPVEGILTVDLSSALLKVTGRRQIQALAQVVFTVTDLAGVRRVVFEFDGRRRDVPRGDGDLTSSPLDRGDYASLEPPNPSPSTTTTTTTTTTTATGQPPGSTTILRS